MSIPHVGLAKIVNEHPQEFYQTGFWNPKYGANTAIPGVDFFRSDDSSAYTVCHSSLKGIRESELRIRNYLSSWTYFS